MHRSSQSPSDSHVCSSSRERYETLTKSEQLRCSRHKSSRERSRSRDARRDSYCRSASNYYRQCSSRSRSNSPYHNKRQNDGRRSKSSLARDICTKNMPTELKLITHDASYFLLKSNNFDNLLLAKAESVWSTPPQNEARINIAFKDSHVCLQSLIRVTHHYPGSCQLACLRRLSAVYSLSTGYAEMILHLPKCDICIIH